jgi:hypothetical protein
MKLYIIPLLLKVRNVSKIVTTATPFLEEDPDIKKAIVTENVSTIVIVTTLFDYFY